MRAEKNWGLDCIFFGERSCLSMQLMQGIIPVHSWPPKQSIFKRRTIHLALSCYSVHKREEKKKKKVGGVTHQKTRLERCYLHLCVAPSKLLIKDSFSPSSRGLLIPLGDENITTSFTSVSSSFLQI